MSPAQMPRSPARVRTRARDPRTSSAEGPDLVGAVREPSRAPLRRKMGDLEPYYFSPLLLLIGLVLVVRAARRPGVEGTRASLYLAGGCTFAGIATLTLVPSVATNERQ